jgi:hypothetical protein
MGSAASAGLCFLGLNATRITRLAASGGGIAKRNN